MGQGSKYSKEDKLRAAVAFQITGSRTQAGKQTGITRETIGKWVSHDKEFAEQYEIAIEQGKKKLDAKLSSLIDGALKVLKDKLIEPDKISAKDAATIAAILYDKRALSRNMPTSIKATDNKGQLAELAQVFDKLVDKANTRPITVYEVKPDSPAKPDYVTLPTTPGH